MKQYFCSNKLAFLNLVIIIGFVLGSCKHKTNFESIAEVSYSSSIAPIINSNCTFSGCHGGGHNNSNYEDEETFELTSYNDVVKHGIEPGSPEKSEFYLVLKSYNQEKVMPRKPYNQLTEKQIQLIYVWIGQGAKNN